MKLKPRPILATAKNLFVTGVFLHLLTGWSSAAAQNPPIELERAHAYFQQFATIGETEAGSFWGVPLYGPLLLVDRQSRFVVTNTPDSAGFLTQQDGVWTGTLPTEQNIANTAFEWAGRRWSMLIWPLPQDVYQRQRLVFHELFHRIQPELNLRLSDPTNAHLASRDGRIWTRLEWRALAEALVRHGDERTQALEDALLFRTHRQQLFPNAASEEKALELNEGLAEYTGLKISGLPQWVMADRAAINLSNREQQRELSRSFAYASGPAYGILLDEGGASWRHTITQDTDLAALVADAYSISFDQNVDPFERAQLYDGARVTQEETLLAHEIEAREARLTARLVDGPTLSLPVAGAFRYSFDPNQAVPLSQLKTVYETARVSAAWGVLVVESGGVLMLREGDNIVGLRVSADADMSEPPSTGTGWTLELAEGWLVEPGNRPGDWVVVRNP